MRLMAKDIGGFSYKTQMCHKLNQNDKTQRLIYCARMLASIYEYEEFLTNVRFLDESHFLATLIDSLLDLLGSLHLTN